MGFKRYLKFTISEFFTRSKRFWRYSLADKQMPILCYHRVTEEQDYLGLSVSLNEFDWHMHAISKSPWLEAVSASRYLAILSGEDGYPERIPVLISFDDGYRDNFINALPILNKHNIPAIQFVVTDILDNKPIWYDVVLRLFSNNDEALLLKNLSNSVKKNINSARECVDYLRASDKDEFFAAKNEIDTLANSMDFSSIYMSDTDIKLWTQAGQEIGAHTCSHPRLSALPEHLVLQEMKGSRETLEVISENKIDQFAYPYGAEEDISSSHITCLKDSGFAIAYTTIQGINRVGDEPFRLKRKCINGGLFQCFNQDFFQSLYFADLMALGSSLKSNAFIGKPRS